MSKGERSLASFVIKSLLFIIVIDANIIKKAQTDYI